jgi:hypothetical protein
VLLGKGVEVLVRVGVKVGVGGAELAVKFRAIFVPLDQVAVWSAW